jgi:hypothetical protein
MSATAYLLEQASLMVNLAGCASWLYRVDQQLALALASLTLHLLRVCVHRVVAVEREPEVHQSLPYPELVQWKVVAAN